MTDISVMLSLNSSSHVQIPVPNVESVCGTEFQNYSILQRDFKSEDDPSPLRFITTNARKRAYFAW